MSTILSDVKGFTPLIDVLVQEVGLMQALVYGRVWRFCQGPQRQCTASLETIGDSLGMSRRTVIRHIKDLCRAGYLEDLTPDRKNRPHIYIDTGRAVIRGLLIVDVADPPGVTESHTNDEAGVTESHTGVTESHTRSDRESHRGVTESHLRRQETKEETREDMSADALLFDLARATAKKQDEEGNWAVPAAAGGTDAFDDGPVTAFAEVCAGISAVYLPRKQKENWAEALRQIAGRWSTEDRVITAAMMEAAIRAIPESNVGWKTYSSPYQGNFDQDIGPILLGGGQAPCKEGDADAGASAHYTSQIKVEH